MNDPIAAARTSLDNVRNALSPEHYDVLKAEALTDAVLALAEEQRTANLIALAASVPVAPETYNLRHDLLHEAMRRIGERVSCSGAPEVTA